MQKNIHSFGVSKFVFQNKEVISSQAPETKKEVVAGIEDPAMKASRKLDKVSKLAETEPFKEEASVTGLQKIGEEFDKARQTVENNKDGLQALVRTEFALQKAIVGSTPKNRWEKDMILDSMEYLGHTNIERQLLAKRRQELAAMTFEEEEGAGMSLSTSRKIGAVPELNAIYHDLQSFHNGDYVLDGPGYQLSDAYVPGTKFPTGISYTPERLEMVIGEYSEPRNNAEKQKILTYLDARLAGQDTAYNEAYRNYDTSNRSQDPAIGRFEESRSERQERLLARRQHIESLVFSK